MSIALSPCDSEPAESFAPARLAAPMRSIRAARTSFGFFTV